MGFLSNVEFSVHDVRISKEDLPIFYDWDLVEKKISQSKDDEKKLTYYFALPEDIDYECKGNECIIKDLENIPGAKQHDITEVFKLWSSVIKTGFIYISITNEDGSDEGYIVLPRRVIEVDMYYIPSIVFDLEVPEELKSALKEAKKKFWSDPESYLKSKEDIKNVDSD